ncbi:hypothetical protein [Devosia sp. FKR38]|uniref:hypothetical protein n=1 Tax=Devosia sp. FKR38 TaxID=2562312 RepID=UPI0010C025DB|nr:hypothetical protein [Devosia sp. FKR38]
MITAAGSATPQRVGDAQQVGADVTDMNAQFAADAAGLVLEHRRQQRRFELKRRNRVVSLTPAVVATRFVV